MQEANATLEETTKKFPKSPEAWSLYGQVRFVLDSSLSATHTQVFQNKKIKKVIHLK